MHIKCEELIQTVAWFKGRIYRAWTVKHSIIHHFSSHSESVGLHKVNRAEDRGVVRHLPILKKKFVCISLVAVLLFGNLGNHITVKVQVLSSQTPPMQNWISLLQLRAPRCAQFPECDGHLLLSSLQRCQRADTSVADGQGALVFMWKLETQFWSPRPDS